MPRVLELSHSPLRQEAYATHLRSWENRPFFAAENACKNSCSGKFLLATVRPQTSVPRAIRLAHPTRAKCSAAIHHAPQAEFMPPFAGKRALSAEWLVPPLGLPFIVDLPARKRG